MPKKSDKGSVLERFAKQYTHSLCAADRLKPLEFLRSGVPGLDDFVLHRTGIPKGRITEIHGPYSSGKTTLALKLITQTQKDYPTEPVFFVDAEGRFNREWAVTCGVDLTQLQMVDFRYGEDLLDKVTSLVALGAPLVVVDSVAGIIPKSLGTLDSLEDVSADKNFARSRLLTTFCDRVAGGYNVPGGSRALKHTRLTHSPTALVFTNHWKNKPRMSSWGPIPDGSVGGDALRYHSSLRIAFARRSSKKEGIGLVNISARKSIICPPGRRADFSIQFGTGDVVCTAEWLSSVCVDAGLFEKVGRKCQIVGGPKKLIGLSGKPQDLLDYLVRHPKSFRRLFSYLKEDLQAEASE